MYGVCTLPNRIAKENMKDKGGRKLKVLCLHGYGYSGAYLKMRLQVWPANVLEAIDFVFIDAPFPTNNKPFPAFSWFNSSPEVHNLLQYFPHFY